MTIPFGPATIRIDAVDYATQIFGPYTVDESPVNLKVTLVPRE